MIATTVILLCECRLKKQSGHKKLLQARPPYCIILNRNNYYLNRRRLR